MTPRPALSFWAIAILLIGGCQRPQPDYRIAVIPKGMTHEFWQSIHRGAVRAADDLHKSDNINVEIVWDGPLRERDALAQIRIVDRQVSRRVSGIVIAPQHSQTMVAPIKRAVEQSIPVVVIDSGLEHPELTLKYVATDNRNGGRLAAKRLLQTLRDDGKPAPRVVLFRYAIGSESTEQRENGFLDVIREEAARQTAAGEKPVELASDNKYAGATKDSAMREASPLLNQFRDAAGNPTIDGIFCCNESSAEGMLDSLKSLRMDRQVKLVGFDAGEPLMQAVAEGTIDALILQDPYRMGYLGTWTLVQHLLKNDVVTQPDPHYLSTGEFVITKENVRSEQTLGLYDKDAQARRTIELPPVRKRP
jgi:ribose transport system substrate-binding protein